MADVQRVLTSNEIDQRLSPEEAFYHGDGTDDSIYLLQDEGQHAVNHRAVFAATPRVGTLHYVYHSVPSDADRIAFIEQINGSSAGLVLGAGYQGHHGLPGENGEPYRHLAEIMKPDVDGKEVFERLWTFLERVSPIHDLLADKLDYLYAIMAGKRPEPRKETLAKAIQKAAKQNEVEELLCKLPKEPLRPKDYNTFSALRDLILSEEISLPSHQTA